MTLRQSRRSSVIQASSYTHALAFYRTNQLRRPCSWRGGLDSQGAEEEPPLHRRPCCARPPQLTPWALSFTVRLVSTSSVAAGGAALGVRMGRGRAPQLAETWWPFLWALAFVRCLLTLRQNGAEQGCTVGVRGRRRPAPRTLSVVQVRIPPIHDEEEFHSPLPLVNSLLQWLSAGYFDAGLSVARVVVGGLMRYVVLLFSLVVALLLSWSDASTCCLSCSCH
jgi:hypothetical protein